MKNLVKSVSCVLVGLALFGFFSCEGETEYVDKIVEKEVEVEKPSDTTPPAKIDAETIATSAGNNTVLLSWTNPSDADFYGTEITFTPKASETTQPVIVTGEAGQKSSAQFYALTNGTEYTFTLVALDKSLKKASGTTKTATPVSSADETPPANVTELVATPGNGKIILSWTNPTDTDFFGVRVSEKTNAGTLSHAVFLESPANTFTVSELANGTDYEFSVIALDKALNESEAMTKNATPVDSTDTTPPANVTNFTVVANDGNAVISWENPTETDFAGVEVSANPAVGTLFYPLLLRKEANTLSVSGLTVGEDYEFMVKAYDQSLNFADGTRKTVTVGDTGDHTAPHIVSNLRATNKGGAVLLTWEEASDADGDLLCYEVTYESVAITVSKGTNYCYVTNLTNGTEYTFTVKSVDTSGNKSEGVAIKETPQESKLLINITLPNDNGETIMLTNDSAPVQVQITSTDAIVKAVWKKGEKKIGVKPEALLADNEAHLLTLDTEANTQFIVEENGWYDVVAQNAAGRFDWEQIEVKTIDVTPLAEVTHLAAKYDEESDSTKPMVLTWGDPFSTDAYDSPLDHVILSYKKNDEGESVFLGEVPAGTQTLRYAVPEGCNADDYLRITIKTVDKFGNTSEGTSVMALCSFELKLSVHKVNNSSVYISNLDLDKISDMTSTGKVILSGDLNNQPASFYATDLVQRINNLPEGVYVYLDLSSITNAKKLTIYKLENCTNLKSIILPAMEKINSFCGCTNLTNVELQSGITFISFGAFLNCTSLTNIVFQDTTTEWFQYSYGSAPAQKESIGTFSSDSVANVQKIRNYIDKYLCTEDYIAE